MKILVDNGHGSNTAGKRSPDRRLLEYSYTREIAKMLVDKLVNAGYEAKRIVAENYDVPLTERCNRANSECDRYGIRNVILVSIHVDAAGNGTQWLNAGGWSAYTSVGKTMADELAECLYASAEKHLKGYARIMEDGKAKGQYGENQKHIRRDMSDGDSDKEANFYILKNTNCPAVLTENLFQDNKKDVAFLLSDEGKRAIVELHFDGIVNYITKVRKR